METLVSSTVFNSSYQASTALFHPTSEDFEVIQQFETGVHPYEYMDSFERFDEASLPPKEAFYSNLTKSCISEEDYEHAKKVWKAFECETLGDYHDLYLLTDTLLLADVFENFRKQA